MVARYLDYKTFRGKDPLLQIQKPEDISDQDWEVILEASRIECEYWWALATLINAGWPYLESLAVDRGIKNPGDLVGQICADYAQREIDHLFCNVLADPDSRYSVRKNKLHYQQWIRFLKGNLTGVEESEVVARISSQGSLDSRCLAAIYPNRLKNYLKREWKCFIRANQDQLRIPSLHLANYKTTTLNWQKGIPIDSKNQLGVRIELL